MSTHMWVGMTPLPRATLKASSHSTVNRPTGPMILRAIGGFCAFTVCLSIPELTGAASLVVSLRVPLRQAQGRLRTLPFDGLRTLPFDWFILSEVEGITSLSLAGRWCMAPVRTETGVRAKEMV